MPQQTTTPRYETPRLVPYGRIEPSLTGSVLPPPPRDALSSAAAPPRRGLAHRSAGVPPALFCVRRSLRSCRVGSLHIC